MKLGPIALNTMYTNASANVEGCLVVSLVLLRQLNDILEQAATASLQSWIGNNPYDPGPFNDSEAQERRRAEWESRSARMEAEFKPHWSVTLADGSSRHELPFDELLKLPNTGQREIIGIKATAGGLHSIGGTSVTLLLRKGVPTSKASADVYGPDQGASYLAMELQRVFEDGIAGYSRAVGAIRRYSWIPLTFAFTYPMLLINYPVSAQLGRVAGVLWSAGSAFTPGVITAWIINRLLIRIWRPWECLIGEGEGRYGDKKSLQRNVIWGLGVAILVSLGVGVFLYIVLPSSNTTE